MSKRAKRAKKYTKKQLRKLRTKILATLHELRHTPILDTALARSIARELRRWARDPRLGNPRLAGLRGRLYATARVLRGAPVPR